MKLIRFTLPLFLIPLSAQLFIAQNETNKWYFGNQAGLDFMTNPPTVLTNGAMTTIEGCATISDAAGNLLFYTNGINVYNQTHAVMDNGTVLGGNSSSSQSAIIAKQPGNTNIYYIFTQSGPGGLGAAYSIVDMSLAAGMGSVTVKNVTLSAVCSEKLTSVKHCNGVDIWAIIHSWNSADFKAFLLTAAGVNTVPVISTIGSTHSVGANFAGCMKTSPNGKKIGLAIHALGVFEMFDFDNTTGVISNSLSMSTSSAYGAYGCEFSPDGTKFYASTGYAQGNLFQWDLCAGSNSAVVASKTTIFTGTAGIAAMQNASNGKIYIARFNQNILGIINNPNVLGLACNYNDVGLSLAPKTTVWSIPNFITSQLKAPADPFTFTTTCSTASFNAPAQATMGASCQNASYSLTNMVWNFGDPGSGAANTSTISNPVHTFSVMGTYTTQLILYYTCGGGTDTLKQVINVSNTAPSLSLAGTYTICSGEKRIYTVSGANTYSWSTGTQASTIAITPTTTTTLSLTYTVTGTNTTTTCKSQKTFTVTVNKCTDFETMISEEVLRLFPNPANQQLNIESSIKGKLIVRDHQGRKLLESTFDAGTHSMDISMLEDGIYFVSFTTTSGVKNMRLVKRGD